jgi:serine/threonine-protein kinase RsbW
MTKVHQMLDFPATTAALADIRNFVNELIQTTRLSENDKEQVVLAVDEAATNIIKHALDYDASQHFSISMTIAGNVLTIVLRDNGKAFDTNKLKEPDLKEYVRIKRKGGLGVYLMRQIMDQVNFKRENTANITELIKALPQ